MLGQIGFIGCILDPDPEQLGSLTELIYTFVKGKLNVAGNRITVPVTHGGLGMINIKDYFIALRCSWVKRAALAQNDLWSVCFHHSKLTNPDLHMPCLLESNLFPVLSVFATAIKEFKHCALLVNNNILERKIRGNPVFGLKQKNRLFRFHVFEQEPEEGQAFNHLMVKDILMDFTVVSLLGGN
jgi:hypothetical protein